MKQKIKNLVILSAVVGLSLAVSGTLHAQAAEKVSISATVYEQGITNGATIKAPTKNNPITAATVVAALHQDEGTPAGGKLFFDGTNFLVIIPGVGGSTNPVTSLTVTPTPGSQYQIIAGTTNTPPVPPYDQTYYQTATVAYGPGSTSLLNFTVTGLGTTTLKATAAAKTGHKEGDFTQTGSFSFQNGTGSGNNITTGNPIVLSGFTLTATGSGTDNITNVVVAQ